MASKIGSFESYDSPAEEASGSALGALLRGHVTEAVEAWKHAIEVRKLCEELSRLNNRMLLDVGVTPEEIARLRAGERFVPDRYQV